MSRGEMTGLPCTWAAFRLVGYRRGRFSASPVPATDTAFLPLSWQRCRPTVQTLCIRLLVRIYCFIWTAYVPACVYMYRHRTPPRAVCSLYWSVSNIYGFTAVFLLCCNDVSLQQYFAFVYILVLLYCFLTVIFMHRHTGILCVPV